MSSLFFAGQGAEEADKSLDLRVREIEAEGGHPRLSDWRASLLDDVEEVLVRERLRATRVGEVSWTHQEERRTPGAVATRPVAGGAGGEGGPGGGRGERGGGDLEQGVEEEDQTFHIAGLAEPGAPPPLGRERVSEAVEDNEAPQARGGPRGPGAPTPRRRVSRARPSRLRRGCLVSGPPAAGAARAHRGPPCTGRGRRGASSGCRTAERPGALVHPFRTSPR